MAKENNRWLICHSLAEGKERKAEHWKSILEAKTHSAGRDDTFKTGKEDFFRAKKDMGNRVWKEWPKTRATEIVFGQDRFTRAVIPVSHKGQVIGRGTYDILEGFFAAGKPVYAWDYEADKFYEVIGHEKNPDPPEERAEQFRQYSFLVYKGEK